MLERSLAALRERGIRRILMVVGFQQEKIRAVAGADVEYIFNPFFRTTNNLASLWMTRPYLEREEFLYLHADLVYQGGMLDALFGPARAPLELLVDPGPVDEEAMKVRLENHVFPTGRLLEASKEILQTEAQGEWTGVARFTPEGGEAFFTEAESLLAREEFQVYDTAAFNRMAQLGTEIRVCSTGDFLWSEVDTREDLELAREIFAAE
jgi:choline kinase